MDGAYEGREGWDGTHEDREGWVGTFEGTDGWDGVHEDREGVTRGGIGQTCRGELWVVYSCHYMCKCIITDSQCKTVEIKAIESVSISASDISLCRPVSLQCVAAGGGGVESYYMIL